jgi:electron transfer flavoprotein-quinone oxidoreductase
MSNEDVMDAVVVGAGLAGLACGHTLADAGLDVAVLERGDAAGSKNLSGGRLYLEPVRPLCGTWLSDAPFERPVVSESIVFTDDQASASFRLDQRPDPDSDPQPPNSVTVLRARLDRHLADKLGEKGGMVLAQQRAEGLIMEGGKVTGARVAGDDLKARVTVAADGALSFLAEEAGLRTTRVPRSYAVGIKEIIQLEAAAIEDRFNLAEGQGASRLYIGRITAGLPGGGFIYTNRESLSVGLVVHVHALQQSGTEEKLWELLERFKTRPDVAPLIRGGKTVEYGAHLIPEGGFRALPMFGMDGLLLTGDAAGLVLNTGTMVRGMDFALASGALAGQSIAAALKADEGAQGALARYTDALKHSFIMEQLRIHRKAPAVLSLNRLYERYPQRVVKWAKSLFEVGPAGHTLSVGKAFKQLRKNVLGWAGYRDLWRLLRM